MPLAFFTHTFDARGNLATLAELTGVKGFAYDKTERLTGVTRTAPAPSAQVESYTWDSEGNKVASHISTAYVTNAANQLLDDGVNTYAYDLTMAVAFRTPKAALGHLTFENSYAPVQGMARLNVLGGSYIASMNYDALQRLFWLESPNDPARQKQFRYFDGDDMALTQSGLDYGPVQWVRYVHGQGTDQPLAMEIYPRGAAPTPGTGKARVSSKSVALSKATA